ncbi:MAG: hypothetical protein HYV27_19450 [Candidatus Hydrogenedentes bacterium]|nr:hypothetical protein [Candidatus Hydrogenedentota bacterium]
MARFWTAVAIGALAGLGAGLYLRAQLMDGGGGALRALLARAGLVQPLAESGPLQAAWHYVHALQEGDWDAAIDRTLWMQERLGVAASSGGAEAEMEARRALRAQLASRNVEGNRLRPEGVEDQYVFTPAATVRYLGSDSGAEDLEAPVGKRVWMEVSYSEKSLALLDRDAVPIQRLRVGVNVSAEGQVLKASIIGNLNIDKTTISTNWGMAPGGS